MKTRRNVFCSIRLEFCKYNSQNRKNWQNGKKLSNRSAGQKINSQCLKKNYSCGSHIGLRNDQPQNHSQKQKKSRQPPFFFTGKPCGKINRQCKFCKLRRLQSKKFKINPSM